MTQQLVQTSSLRQYRQEESKKEMGRSMRPEIFIRFVAHGRDHKDAEQCLSVLGRRQSVHLTHCAATPEHDHLEAVLPSPLRRNPWMGEEAHPFEFGFENITGISSSTAKE